MALYMPAGRPRGGQTGYSYIALLFIVAIMGSVLAGVGSLWSKTAQREKEVELLLIGNQFRNAIGFYYNSQSSGIQTYPRRLEDLLLDPRQPAIRRYLREIYIDPMTGSNKWGLVKSPEGFVMGVYSLSAATPIKKKNFKTIDAAFENQSKYSEWQFVYKPAGVQ